MRLILVRIWRGWSTSYLYIVKDDRNVIRGKRESKGKYVACLYREDTRKITNFFGSIDIVRNGKIRAIIRNFRRENIPFSIVYTKDGIEHLVRKVCSNSKEEAIEEAMKHATVITRYCNICEENLPSFRDEDFCLICGYEYRKRKDPDIIFNH